MQTAKTIPHCDLCERAAKWVLWTKAGVRKGWSCTRHLTQVLAKHEDQRVMILGRVP